MKMTYTKKDNGIHIIHVADENEPDENLFDEYQQIIDQLLKEGVMESDIRIRLMIEPYEENVYETFEWAIEVTKSANGYVMSLSNKFEDIAREYNINDTLNFVDIELSLDRLSFYSDTKKYHLNLTEEGCIIGDIYTLEGDGEFFDTFACYNILNQL